MRKADVRAWIAGKLAKRFIRLSRKESCFTATGLGTRVFHDRETARAHDEAVEADKYALSAEVFVQTSHLHQTTVSPFKEGKS